MHPLSRLIKAYILHILSTLACIQMAPVQGVGSQQEVQATLQALVKSAADWQASGLQRQGSNTGVCLRSNFLLMAAIVVKQDAHLLASHEKELLEAFQVTAASIMKTQLSQYMMLGDMRTLKTVQYNESMMDGTNDGLMQCINHGMNE